MHILMIAPEPFLEPRGTPFSVYHRVRALSQLGHTIDLVTYPIGKAITLPHVRLYRSWSIPFLHRVKIGPSLAKLPLDALLFVRAAALLLSHRYDCIHTHEEAGLFGALVRWLTHTPHIYDMHSDLAQQMTNFHFTRSRLLINAMRAVERVSIHSASVVIVICAQLQETVASLAPGKPAVLIENTAVGEETEEQGGSGEPTEELERLRGELAIPEDTKAILLYTGTFEAYQGIELLVESIPAVLADFPKTIFLLVGGHPEQVTKMAALGQRLGVSQALRLPGQRPPEEMPLFMRLADVLLSPRCQGTNTPLKIYSYLHAGKPILATNIHSHTQVLTDDVALLVNPTSLALGQGALHLLADEALRSSLSRNARLLAKQRYGYETFLAQTAQAYRHVTA